MHRERVSYIYTQSHFLTPSPFIHNSYTVVLGYRSLGLPVFMVPIATGCCLSANGISVSMVSGCTRANPKKSVVPVLPVFCIGMINHHHRPQTPTACVCPGATSATEQVLLGAHVSQVNIDVGTLCTSGTEGGMVQENNDKNQSSSLFAFAEIQSPSKAWSHLLLLRDRERQKECLSAGQQ